MLRPIPKRDASQNAATTTLEAEETGQVRKARRIIEELDYGQFGGPSFGPQTIELMSTALEGCRGFLARTGIGPAASIDRRDDLEGSRGRRARSNPPEGRGDIWP